MSKRTGIPINMEECLIVQNIEPIISNLESPLEVFRIKYQTKFDINGFYEHLIAKMLLKSGRLNTVYENNPVYDEIVENIKNQLINDAAHRFLDSIIFENLVTPINRQTNYTEVYLKVKGYLLFMNFVQTDRRLNLLASL